MGVRIPSESEIPACIELHIEELVLHGFPVAHRSSIGDAVERELHRLLAVHGLGTSARAQLDIESLDGGTFQIANNARPRAVGALLAQQLHRQVSTEPNRSQQTKRARSRR